VEQQKLPHLRALVVDDSRVMRGMVMQTLRGIEVADFEFTEASSGSEALGKFDPDAIDIIFVDWNMPEMDGVEFAHQIRSTGWANHVPVVMITSETGDEKRKAAFDKARITCYITKPFTPEEIAEKVGPLVAKLEEKRSGGKSAASPAPAAASKGGFFSKLIGG
jgi:two-component system, chemotaxis family, chemotaxis protein CheY